jgi:hypothetical protein
MGLGGGGAGAGRGGTGTGLGGTGTGRGGGGVGRGTGTGTGRGGGMGGGGAPPPAMLAPARRSKPAIAEAMAANECFIPGPARKRLAVKDQHRNSSGVRAASRLGSPVPHTDLTSGSRRGPPRTS